MKRDDLDIINYMFFQTSENLEKLGQNSEPVRRLISGKSEREVTYAIMGLIQDLYSGNPIIRRFPVFLKKGSSEKDYQRQVRIVLYSTISGIRYSAKRIRIKPGTMQNASFIESDKGEYGKTSITRIPPKP